MTTLGVYGTGQHKSIQYYPPGNMSIPGSQGAQRIGTSEPPESISQYETVFSSPTSQNGSTARPQLVNTVQNQIVYQCSAPVTTGGQQQSPIYASSFYPEKQQVTYYTTAPAIQSHDDMQQNQTDQQQQVIVYYPNSSQIQHTISIGQHNIHSPHFSHVFNGNPAQIMTANSAPNGKHQTFDFQEKQEGVNGLAHLAAAAASTGTQPIRTYISQDIPAGTSSQSIETFVAHQDMGKDFVPNVTTQTVVMNPGYALQQGVVLQASLPPSTSPTNPSIQFSTTSNLGTGNMPVTAASQLSKKRENARTTAQATAAASERARQAREARARRAKQAAERAKALVSAESPDGEVDDKKVNLKEVVLRSKYNGVRWYKRTNKWVVQIRRHGKRKHVGYFSDEEEAARAYKRACENPSF